MNVEVLTYKLLYTERH